VFQDKTVFFSKVMSPFTNGTSGRTMERMGLQLAYTKMEWTPFDRLQPPDDTIDPFTQ
jgi:hypothetical protein